MAFAGIGDAATQVIKEQNQIGMQGASIAENARQFDISARQRRDQLAEQARQFDIQQAENARQFDVSQAEQAGRLAVSENAATMRQRAQLGEEARQFNARDARQAAEFDWKRNVDAFGMNLEALTSQAEMEKMDLDKQLVASELAQSIQATKQEQAQMANREKVAKAGFYGLFTSSLMNGGRSAAAANELMKKKLNLKKGSVYAITDYQAGILQTHIIDDNGVESVLQTPMAVFYANYRDDFGEKAADALYQFWDGNRAVQAQMDVAKARASAKSEADGDRLRMSALVSQADSIGKRLADMEKTNPYAATTKEYEELSKREKMYRAEIDKGLGIGGETAATAETPQQKLARITEPGSLKVREDVRQKLNLPENTEARIDPATGETVAAYKKGGKWVFLRLSE